MAFGNVFGNYRDFQIATASWKPQTLPTTPYTGLMGFDGTNYKAAVGTTWYNLMLGPTGGSGVAVELQTSTPGTAQTGNFNISGDGIAGTAFHSPAFYWQASSADVWKSALSSGSWILQAYATGPVNGPNAALAGAGAGNVDNGVHIYQVTFVTAGGETGGATGLTTSATVADKAVDGKVSLTGIETGLSGWVTARKIYRTVAGGSTYKLLATISDNTTTTYTDNIADASLGATMPTTNTALDTRVTVSAAGALQFGAGSLLNGQTDSFLLLANGAGTDFTGLRFGGTSSSFPMLKRSGNGLLLRKADDSGTGAFTCSDITANSLFIGTSGAFNARSSNADIRIAGNYPLAWSTASDDTTGTLDTGIARLGAGVLTLTNGGAGYTSGCDLQASLSALTAGTMTATSTAQALMRVGVSEFTWTNAQVAALTGTADDITVCTLPAKTVVKSARIVVTTAAGTVATLTGSVGYSGSPYTDYIGASDLMAAANTTYANATYLNSMPSYTGTTAVKMHFISTGGNLSTVTTCAGKVILETMTIT